MSKLLMKLSGWYTIQKMKATRFLVEKLEPNISEVTFDLRVVEEYDDNTSEVEITMNLVLFGPLKYDFYPFLDIVHEFDDEEHFLNEFTQYFLDNPEEAEL